MKAFWAGTCYFLRLFTVPLVVIMIHNHNRQ